jgi:hypothetical protein
VRRKLRRGKRKNIDIGEMRREGEVRVKVVNENEII